MVRRHHQISDIRQVESSPWLVQCTLQLLELQQFALSLLAIRQRLNQTFGREDLAVVARQLLDDFGSSFDDVPAQDDVDSVGHDLVSLFVPISNESLEIEHHEFAKLRNQVDVVQTRLPVIHHVQHSQHVGITDHRVVQPLKNVVKLYQSYFLFIDLVKSRLVGPNLR